MNAITKSAAIVTRSARPLAQKGQKRNIVDWMTNYPDKVCFSFFFGNRKNSINNLHFGFVVPTTQQSRYVQCWPKDSIIW